MLTREERLEAIRLARDVEQAFSRLKTAVAALRACKTFQNVTYAQSTLPRGIGLIESALTHINDTVRAIEQVYGVPCEQCSDPRAFSRNIYYKNGYVWKARLSNQCFDTVCLNPHISQTESYL